MNPRKRILKLLLRVLNNPRRYTRQQLADYFGQTKAAIGSDIDIINSLPELSIHYQEPPYLCYIEPNNKYSELNTFQALSEEDRYHINQALDRSVNTRLAQQLKSKVEGLYDFQQLGFRQLRHPAIERINRLEGAKERKQQVVLVRYRSNSNNIKNRTVEPFLINPELDTLQAFDYEHLEPRHFRLSRIERVELLETPWENEQRHFIRSTDIFRIANNKQYLVKLRLTVQAFNVLIEHYPMAISYTEPDSSSPHHFLLQARVNAEFLGLSNFILGYAEDVEIIAPEELKENIREKAAAILRKTN